MLEGARMKDFTSLGDSNVEKADDYNEELLIWKDMDTSEIQKSLDKSIEILQSMKDENPNRVELERVFLDAIGEGDRGALLWPLRVALTGKKASPGPFEIMEILGIEESLARIRAAKQKLE
jgi:glutamyl/glutaminyl-tRNA synthetase